MLDSPCCLYSARLYMFAYAKSIRTYDLLIIDVVNVDGKTMREFRRWCNRLQEVKQDSLAMQTREMLSQKKGLIESRWSVHWRRARYIHTIQVRLAVLGLLLRVSDSTARLNGLLNHWPLPPLSRHQLVASSCLPPSSHSFSHPTGTLRTRISAIENEDGWEDARENM